MGRSRTLGLAAETAFWLFLSLVPIAAVGALIAARFAIGNSSVVSPAFESLPGPAREMIWQELSRVAKWNGGSVAPLAAIVFVWLASSGVHAVFDAFEAETHDMAPPRPWWRKRLIAIATCIGLSIGVAVLALVGVGLGWLEQFAGHHIAVARISGSPAGALVRLLVGASVFYGVVAALYLIGIPKRAREQMPLAPGTLFVVVLQLALGFAYTLYLSRMGTGGAYQAGLAVVGVTMMSVYLFAVSLLAGLELNRLLGERRGVMYHRHA